MKIKRIDLRYMPVDRIRFFFSLVVMFPIWNAKSWLLFETKSIMSQYHYLNCRRALNISQPINAIESKHSNQPTTVQRWAKSKGINSWLLLAWAENNFGRQLVYIQFLSCGWSLNLISIFFLYFFCCKQRDKRPTLYLLPLDCLANLKCNGIAAHTHTHSNIIVIRNSNQNRLIMLSW